MKAFLISALLTRVDLADAVIDWNVILRTTISAETPQAQSRFAAITHLAVFEAVNAITRDYEGIVTLMDEMIGKHSPA